MKTSTLFSTLLVCLFTIPAYGAVRGSKAMYVGGTIPDIAEKTRGKFDFTREDAAVFTTDRGKTITIAYKNIESLEFGQKAGRRVGVAVVVNPLFLFSKKRKHFLSLGFMDEQGRKQGAVFELAKGLVRNALSTFETRSGKPIEYESEETRKHAGN